MEEKKIKRLRREAESREVGGRLLEDGDLSARPCLDEVVRREQPFHLASVTHHGTFERHHNRSTGLQALPNVKDGCQMLWL